MIDNRIKQLADYALAHGLIMHTDYTYTVNRLLHALRLDAYHPTGDDGTTPPLCEILSALCDEAVAAGIIEADSVVYRDLFDTELMGLLTPRPSIVIDEFRRRYADSPEAATDYYYQLSRDTNYIRTDRIARDCKWTVDSPYGKIDITINLSKPEKDPRAIAAAKLSKPSGYPLCALCPQNEGYAVH